MEDKDPQIFASVVSLTFPVSVSKFPSYKKMPALDLDPFQWGIMSFNPIMFVKPYFQILSDSQGVLEI